MRTEIRFALVAAAAAFILSAGGSFDPAMAQKKASGDKRSACIAKARAENPDRMAGNARQAAFNRCMRGG